MSKFVKYRHEEEALHYLKGNYNEDEQCMILLDKSRLDFAENLLGISYFIYLAVVTLICLYFGTVDVKALSRLSFGYLAKLIIVVKFSIISSAIALALFITVTELLERTIGKRWMRFYYSYLEKRLDTGGFNEKKI